MSDLYPALISCDEDTQAFAEAELKEMFLAMPPISWIEGSSEQPSGVGKAELPLDFSAFSQKIIDYGSIFIRHVAPIDHEIPLTGDSNDLPALREAVASLTPRIEPAQTLSVQSRLLQDDAHPFRRTELNQVLFEELAANTGVTLDARHPVQVVSVTCAPNRAYLGLSLATQNRSLWPGGQMRFKREEGQISRAEFKLLEAISVFDLTLPIKGTALDMGAAPGGWTNVLRQLGLRVIAVDPAELHPSLRHDRQIIHIRQRIQNYRPPEMFDVIVNDLKMDARDSIEIMLMHRRRLKPGGIAVMTLKLPKTVPSPRAMLEFVQADLQRLSSGFRIRGARQLFHNRSEITVALSA